MRQKKSRRGRKAGFSEEPAPYKAGQDAAAPARQSVELGAGGRIVIPAPMRAALGMKTGDRLTVRMDGDELRIYTLETGLRRARELVRPYLPENAVDEFLRWKREEAAREAAEIDCCVAKPPSE